jgi:hypothetical protein
VGILGMIYRLLSMRFMHESAKKIVGHFKFILAISITILLFKFSHK